MYTTDNNTEYRKLYSIVRFVFRQDSRNSYISNNLTLSWLPCSIPSWCPSHSLLSLSLLTLCLSVCLFYNTHIKPHIDYVSIVWDGYGEVHLKKLNFLHRRAGKLNLRDPSLFSEQKISALGILNLPQQLTYNKGVFMHKVLNNNFPNYLAQLFISHQSDNTNSRNNLYVPRPRLDLFKTSISFAGASLWNSLPQN